MSGRRRARSAQALRDRVCDALALMLFAAVLAGCVSAPRDGAFEAVREMSSLGARRVVYVSCNPATLARDAGEMARQGYRLKRAGILDMFPQTAHVEAMALFEAG